MKIEYDTDKIQQKISVSFLARVPVSNSHIFRDFVIPNFR